MSPSIPPHVFRAYDIRGKAYDELSPDFCQLAGRAIAEEVRRRGGQRVAVVRDCRTSSPVLASALIEGLRGAGVDVADQGMGPTPLLYFAVIDGGFDAGVVVTGSHNPIGDNGLKLVYADGAAYGEAIQALRVAMEGYVSAPEDAIDAPPPPRGAYTLEDRRDAYVAAVLKDLRPARRRLIVSVDGGSGAAGPLAMRVLQAMGHTVIGHAIAPDGTFPIHHPDPTTEASIAYMAERVREDGADLCVGFDGDGDRVGVVDDQGRAILGDRLSALLLPSILDEHPGRAVLGEVKCSNVLFETIDAHGGHAVMARVGHSVMKAQMQATNAVFAGEVSGHFFFADRWFGFDDGIYAAARVVEWLATTDRSLSSWDASLERRWSTPELRVPCPDAWKFEVVERVTNDLQIDATLVTIDGVRASWSDGWGLVRASNTQPVLVIRAEATSQARCDALLERLQTAIDAAYVALAKEGAMSARMRDVEEP